MADHPNKHIREAIAYAESQGWRVSKAAREPMFGARCGARIEAATDAASV